jgi:hypothetical protein
MTNNDLQDIRIKLTSFGGSLRLINSEAVMKSVNSSIPITGYASETYSIIEHIPYNLILE